MLTRSQTRNQTILNNDSEQNLTITPPSNNENILYHTFEVSLRKLLDKLHKSEDKGERIKLSTNIYKIINKTFNKINNKQYIHILWISVYYKTLELEKEYNNILDKKTEETMLLINVINKLEIEIQKTRLILTPIIKNLYKRKLDRLENKYRKMYSIVMEHIQKQETNKSNK